MPERLKFSYICESSVGCIPFHGFHGFCRFKMESLDLIRPCQQELFTVTWTDWVSELQSSKKCIKGQESCCMPWGQYPACSRAPWCAVLWHCSNIFKTVPNFAFNELVNFHRALLQPPKDHRSRGWGWPGPSLPIITQEAPEPVQWERTPGKTPLLFMSMMFFKQTPIEPKRIQKPQN